MSCSIALRRSPKPGSLDGHGAERAADLVDHEGGQGLALDVLGDDQQRLAALHDLLEHGEQVLDRGDLAVHEQDVRVLEDRFLTLGVAHEVRGQVALVELHALGELELHAEGVRLLDGDHAVLAHLVDGVGEDLADGRVGRRRWRRPGRSPTCRRSPWPGSRCPSTAAATAASMPRLRLSGLAPAATLRRPSRTSACASTVAVVVPSPAMSLVLVATSFTSWAPMFSNGSSSSTSRAMDTPSLVMVGAPNFFSSTTLRPLGPMVTFTASASLLTPASRARRASSSNLMSLAIGAYLTIARMSRPFRMRTSSPPSVISVPPYLL